MPDTALVKRCIIMNDPSIMNQTSLFPFSKLQYVELCSGDCSILSLLKILNKTEIHHICLNDGVSKELLQFIVNEFPNLRTLEVADFSDLERISTCNTSVTTFKWNHYLGHGKECYDMESINIHDVLSDLIAPCFPNLQHIEIENPTFHIDIIQLVRLWTNTTPLFPSLKKLSIHVVVYECEHKEQVLSRVEWMKFCDLKHLPELELSCEYSTVASLLLALFESKAKRLKIHVIDQECGGIRFSSMHELLENVFEQDVSTQLKGILSERISSKVITYETDYESSEESEDEEEEEEDDEDHDEDEEEDE
ncbi:hypothetical protein C9374_012027 [Naegleria lovaniensis]|uniref:Uncharacterized protein n=1 Tax=Naegleria lovaniensis TaxID=51637 RepID=A0AA88KEB0_NAELO|nr:uncharacterized protein C9374_012027 [Naegleria lovaniensis]KAG2373564.1 hypothetical protein C9374_012027 [Naegleria lovaniensis]